MDVLEFSHLIRAYFVDARFAGLLGSELIPLGLAYIISAVAGGVYEETLEKNTW